jgi:LPXTG-motif cell wall-anchored protein
MNTTRTRRSLAALAAGGLLTLATALPATAVVLPDPIGTAPAAPVPQVVVPDTGLELSQLALGALGGIALAGAGAVAIRARRHHHPQPV